MSRIRSLLVGIGVAVGIALLLPAATLAHERREVGAFDFVVGWMSEPAYVGQKNGIDLRVTNREDQQAVEGLKQTLRAEVLFGGQRREIELRPVFQQPGRYTADLVPTREGDYRFRFVGTVDGASVDETFDSADGRFDGVTSIQPIQFPERVPAAGEVAALATTADQNAAAARQAAAASQTLAMVGIVVGALGVVIGGTAVAGSRRRPPVAARKSDADTS